MPLLATFIGNLAGWLAGVLATQFAYSTALRIASYTVWIVTAVAFIAAVFGCVSSLYSGMTAVGSGGGGWTSYMWVGLGMFIPQNAQAVLSCVASVWIATSLWKIKRIGIENFSK
ncbi:DUF5455 family protein [Variovorax sp. PBL-E5]|uniref:DUF5455 family protein n=1 Tax=Variovorax sp. PBL-E5 TaxID=434014 RepID=UPI001316156A|nr:DUF5455 family protein [Variovorax sp. PBL-E5]VTU36331.1 minor coat protein [Variovorax sp. PBL-E5]